MISPTDQQIDLFMSLIRGRMDVYARRWEKEGRSGYSPAYEFNWDEFMAHKRQGGSLKDFENKRLLPLTREVIKKHLLGMEVAGVYPILPENTSWFLAADFDGESWNDDAIAFIDACTIVGLGAYLERSRSGKGGHTWIFFSAPYPCYRSRQIGFELVRRAFQISEFDKEVSFDRFFPNQDSASTAGFGNLIALPLQGESVSQGNTVFIDLKTGVPFSDQWAFLQGATRHSAQEIEAAHQLLVSRKSGLSMPFSSAGTAGLSIVVSNHLALDRSQVPPELADFLKDELNFVNTEYLTKRRLGRSTYKVQKYFKLIEESGDLVFLPRGFLDTLVKYLKVHNVGHSVRHEHPLLGDVPFKSCIELMPSQTGAVVSALTQNQGVIVAPSGSGKTVIGLELIARRKLPALILVHRKQILDQWVERIQAFLGISKPHIGQYCGTKKKIGSQITVALLQSLCRRKDFSDLTNQFGTIVIDECHHIPASTFRYVVSRLNPHYLYGLTATPKRKHNDERLIYVYIGEVIARIEGGDTPPAPSTAGVRRVEVIVRDTSLAIPFTFRTDLFHLLAKVICFDTARNRLIVDDILSETDTGKKVLVLSERKEHLEILNLYLKGKREVIVISGDDSARARGSKMKQIKDGHYQAILSTGQFFGEGIDTRGVTCLILAFPFSFEGKLVQYVGRLRDIGARKRIIDYRDGNIPFLERQFKQRERAYKRLLSATVELGDTLGISA